MNSSYVGISGIESSNNLEAGAPTIFGSNFSNTINILSGGSKKRRKRTNKKNRSTKRKIRRSKGKRTKDCRCKICKCKKCRCNQKNRKMNSKSRSRRKTLASFRASLKRLL